MELSLKRSSSHRKQTAVHNAEITMRDVAQMANVSEMTVSRVIRNKGYVASSTRELVLKAAADLGYVPNQIAGALASRSTNLIGIVVPTLTNQVYAQVLAGIHSELRATPYQPVFGITDYDAQREEELIRDMLAWRPSGLVVSGNNQTRQARKMIRQASIPFVQIMEHISRPLQFSVGVDHDAIGRTIAEHLLSRGYRSVAYIGNNLDHDTAAQRRYSAFRAVILDAGASLDSITVADQVSSNTLGHQLTEKLLSEHPAVDSVHFANDTLAIGGMLYCLAHNIAVPDDLAMCGYVGLEAADCLPVTLTTVSIPRREIGEAAGRYLVDQLTNDGALKALSVQMPFELKRGKST